MTVKKKKIKEYVAIEGLKFTIEWYFDPRGRSHALDYFENMDDNDQIKLLGLFELMANVGGIKSKTKFRYESDKIYAFKPQPHRFLCFFFKGYKIIVTNAFHKKTDKLPENEKKRAMDCKDDYESRIKRGDYYD